MNAILKRNAVRPVKPSKVRHSSSTIYFNVSMSRVFEKNVHQMRQLENRKRNKGLKGRLRFLNPTNNCWDVNTMERRVNEDVHSLSYVFLLGRFCHLIGSLSWFLAFETLTFACTRNRDDEIHLFVMTADVRFPYITVRRGNPRRHITVCVRLWLSICAGSDDDERKWEPRDVQDLLLDLEHADGRYSKAIPVWRGYRMEMKSAKRKRGGWSQRVRWIR